jgi:zinc D-Ala-D-Ala carboxypeptidase
MDLSANFTLEELVHSQTAERQGIDNTPTPAIEANLGLLAHGLETVRALLGRPMIISSGYRSPALNAAVGGAANSQHMLGLAADFTCPAAGTPADICKLIQASDIAFDQLIYEYTWCHISFVVSNPRRQTLTLNKTTRGYMDGIVV